MRGVLAAAILFFAFASTAGAGGPYMMVGAAEDLPKQASYADSKVQMDKLRLAGLDTIRLTATWRTGERELPAASVTPLTNAIQAAQFSGVRVILSVYPFGSSVTPLTAGDRSDFAAFVVDLANRYPLVHDFVIGNEPNLNRFWLPQFGPNGEDVAAPAYEQLLATTYDALKALRPHTTIYGGALAPRGVDKPNTGRDTHSPTTFIADLGAAYRASGRALPIMDALAFHPYPETSAVGPDFPHPNSTAIGLADYDKLIGLLGAAFDGTAQRGTQLPILYDEFGIETVIPATHAAAYTGTEPATTHPVDEATQARMYAQAMAMVFCQPTVIGLLLFHVVDEVPLSAWQSGMFYADGAAKSSLAPVGAAAGSVHRGVISTCSTLTLTPRVSVLKPHRVRAGLAFSLHSDLDARFVLHLDGGHTLTGKVVGGTPKALLFRGRVRRGRHVIQGTANAAANTGPPGVVRLAFTA